MTLEETWLERVLTWRASGLSATAFCEGAEFGAGALRSWSSRFGREGKVSRSPLGRQRKKEPGPGVRFARVVTAAATEPEPRPEPEAAAVPSRAAPSVVVVALGQARIEVSAGFEPSLLRAVVGALEGGAR
jgi:hypothetical protein